MVVVLKTATPASSAAADYIYTHISNSAMDAHCYHVSTYTYNKPTSNRKIIIYKSQIISLLLPLEYCFPIVTVQKNYEYEASK